MEEKNHKRINKRKIILSFIAIFCSFLVYFLLPQDMPEAGKRVAAVFIFGLFFWSFEIIPLYATSLTLIILLCFLLATPFDILGIGKMGLQLFIAPFASPIIMLFLGGLVLAAAAHKQGVDLYLMEKMTSKIGQRSHLILWGFIFIAAFFSLWISNTAATAMMLLLANPLLIQLQKNDPFRKAILLGIAFGGNIGGIGTPIGTPPNAIAIGILRDYGIEIDFFEWMSMGVPLAIILLLVTGFILLYFFPPHTKKMDFHIEPQKLTRKGKWVLIIAIAIITLWITKPWHQIPEELVALLAVAILASFQLISVKDLRGISWDILILIWGGLALGEAIQTSGLISQVGKIPFFMQKGMVLIVIFCTLALLLTSFISNTVTANLLLPIAISLDPESTGYLAIAVALACSFSFAFPISTPPNALVYESGDLTIKDMFKAGAIISVISLIILLSGFEFVVPKIFKNL